MKNAVFQQIDNTKIIQINTTHEHILALSSQKVIHIKSKKIELFVENVIVIIKIINPTVHRCVLL